MSIPHSSALWEKLFCKMGLRWCQRIAHIDVSGFELGTACVWTAMHVLHTHTQTKVFIHSNNLELSFHPPKPKEICNEAIVTLLLRSVQSLV